MCMHTTTPMYTARFIGANSSEKASTGVEVHQPTLPDREQPAGWANVPTMWGEYNRHSR